MASHHWSTGIVIVLLTLPLVVMADSAEAAGPGDSATTMGSQMPSLRVGRARMAALSHGSEILIIGGDDGSPGGPGVIERLDPAADSLTRSLATIPGSNQYPRPMAVKAGDAVYVFGLTPCDQYYCRGIARYDPVADTSIRLTVQLAPGGYMLAQPVWDGLRIDIPYTDLSCNYCMRFQRFDPQAETITIASSQSSISNGAATSWDGSRLRMLGFCATGGCMVSWDPSLDTLTTQALPNFPGGAAVFDGSTAWGVQGDAIWKYLIATDSVHVAGVSLPSRRHDPGMVLHGGDLFIIGGIGCRKYCDEVFRYDIATDNGHVMVSKLPQTVTRLGTSFAAATWTGTSAFIFGGAQDEIPSEAIFRYDTKQDRLVRMNARLPGGLAQAGIVWTGQGVYLFGGATRVGDATVASDRILRYDPATDLLQVLPQTLPYAICGVGAAWTGSEVILIGGFRDGACSPNGAMHPNVLSFSPATGTVTDTGATLPSHVCKTRAWYIAGAVYAFSGSCPYGSPPIYRYDPSTNAVAQMGLYSPGSEAVWTGIDVLIVGSGSCCSAQVYRYNPRANELKSAASQLPTYPYGTAPIWNGEAMYTFGGSSNIGFFWYADTSSIVRYRPAGAPLDLVAAGGPGRGQIQLTWSPPPGWSHSGEIQGYRVHRGTAPGALTYLTTVSGGTLGFVDSSLPDAETRYYRVSTVTVDGETALSYEVAGRSLSLPGPPESLNASAGPDEGEASLTWAPPSETRDGAITSYVIQRATSRDGPFRFVDSVSTTSFVDRGLEAGTHFYRVAASTAVGTGPPSAQSSTTVAGSTSVLPTAPRALKATNGEPEHVVELAWDPPATGSAGVLQYKIYRARGDGGFVAIAGTDGAIARYRDTTTHIGDRYHYQVSAVTIQGEGPRSAPAKITPGRTGYVLIHGICSDGRMWSEGAGAAIGATLRTKGPTLAPSYSPGVGGTPLTMREALRYQIQQFELENPNIEQVVLVGHSLGGLMSRMLLRDYGAELKIAHVVGLDSPDGGMGGFAELVKWTSPCVDWRDFIGRWLARESADAASWIVPLPRNEERVSRIVYGYCQESFAGPDNARRRVGTICDAPGELRGGLDREGAWVSGAILVSSATPTMEGDVVWTAEAHANACTPRSTSDAAPRRSIVRYDVLHDGYTVHPDAAIHVLGTVAFSEAAVHYATKRTHPWPEAAGEGYSTFDCGIGPAAG